MFRIFLGSGNLFHVPKGWIRLPSHSSIILTHHYDPLTLKFQIDQLNSLKESEKKFVQNVIDKHDMFQYREAFIVDSKWMCLGRIHNRHGSSPFDDRVLAIRVRN